MCYILKLSNIINITTIKKLSLLLFCIRESNFRNDSTCLLHLVLGIIVQQQVFTSYESSSRKHYEW